MKKYIILLCIAAIIEISLSLYLTVWREHFWNAISNKQSVTFFHQLLVFLGVALSCCFLSGITGYIVSLATIKWREKLNSKAFSIQESGMDNLNQRIQEDCFKYPQLVLTLGVGLSKAILYILIFSISLLVSFHWYYLLVLLGYSILGSYFAQKIAYPLIKLNYQQQNYEATYRNTLSIENFQDCLQIMLGLAKKQKHLTYFQQFYLQIAVVIPLIIIAPYYFNSAMTVGELMRFTSTSGTILDNMSYGISTWDSINMLLSCRRRLKEINII